MVTVNVDDFVKLARKRELHAGMILVENATLGIDAVGPEYTFEISGRDNTAVRVGHGDRDHYDLDFRRAGV